MRLLLLLCAALVVHSADPLPSNIFRGIAITPGGPLTLADNATLVLIDEAKNIGSDWIFVNSYLSQFNASSSHVFRGPQAPLNSALKSYILLAQSKGLKVLLKPIVIPIDGSSWLQIIPTNVFVFVKLITQ